MRGARKKGRKLTAKKSPPRLTTISQEQLRTLEKKLSSLEVRLHYVEANLGIHPSLSEEKIEKRRGPAPKLPDELLFEIRDRYVDWLEFHWSDLCAEFYSAAQKNPEDIEATLERVAGPEAQWTHDIRDLIYHSGQLLEFLRSNRFHKKPPRNSVLAALNRSCDDKRRMRAAARLPTRQIANAMAGVPNLGWRTSLDKCSKNPSRLVVGKQTEEHYRGLYKIPVPTE